MIDETTPLPKPGEMPTAYLVRVGATEEAYDHYEAARDALIVNQLACLTRRHEAVKAYRWLHSVKLDDVEIKGTDMPLNVVAFYSTSKHTKRPSQFDWSEQDYYEYEVEAVYDASTWEDVTKFVDVTEETIEQELKK